MESVPASETELENYLANVKKRVSSRLKADLLSRRAILDDINPAMTRELLDALNQTCAGGKMLRAALVDLGFQIAGGDEGNKDLLPIQAAIELTHVCLLIHDDIMDRSEKRRDKETLHQVFARLHKEKGYRGNSNDYGKSIAMLAGDVAICLAFDFALGSRFPEDRKVKAMSHFVENLIRTGLGQAMDVNLTVKSDVERSEIHRTTLYKTAFYTVVAPLQLGGLLNGASEQVMTAFEGFGRPLGEAYQLQDDLLGVFGAEKIIGKSILSDLREGKRTLLFQYGLERATGDNKEHLKNCIGNPNVTDADLTRVQKTLHDSGAREQVTQEMNAQKESAKETIAALTQDDRLSRLLEQFCDYIVRRND